MSAKPLYADQFKRNDDEFRYTMEAIFQKYSNLNDPGIDVCLKTMTCRTARGPVPIDSAEGERELEKLKTRVKADYSIRELEDHDNDQMDVSGVTEDDLNGSGQKENSENLWDGGGSFQLSMSLNNTSNSSQWDELSQPKEEDEELEKTLSSHGSTLLDVYPSMLNQIGEAYRRQHVTDTARAVVQKYRRKHWQAGPTYHNSSFRNRHNCTLNKTTNTSFTSQSPVQRNTSNCFKGSDKLQNLLKNKLKSSPLKNSSYEASACFYSPKRNSADVSGVTDQSSWTDLHLTRKPEQITARVIDFSTPPYSASASFSDQSSNLDQTYDVVPTSHAVPASRVFTSPRQSKAGLSIIDQRGMSVIAQPSSLDKDCFRDCLHSPVSSPQRGLIGVLSSRGKSSFRPSVLNMEKQFNLTASPKQRSPVHHLSHTEALRSPYGTKRLCKAEKPFHFTPSKRQRSLSGPQSTYSFNETQIDAEFRKLYHHFICRGISSPCPSSHCHLCERHSKETFQSPSFSSSSMSALALTPLRAKLKKRQRQPEVEESLRFKRFRESRSPLKHLQLTGRYVNSAMSEPTEDKLTWDRAVLLQCPSPQFLRGTGNLRRIREANLRMQINQRALSWRDAPSDIHPVEAVSPMRLFNQGTAPFSPSLSRRRLQYGLQQ
ncbi:uncharacterized protein si:dkeyp-117h8.4 isoform X2 [Pimephales promelas]|uniref:uncharacterized protein si:dkeyp-117h8.4 isoform X2 n=1 Tax=Pimephales promelas TaxID=90988 RepID=UPI0019555700|nr:uncharacterized protein si:dkeyp-117h8.4 isoform X2 [Pimephales promelas]KAG1964379.1 hypothetical protein F2P79_004273 [Pimephales promelas]